MPYERKSGYELKFIDDDHFEILCLDYSDTYGVRRQLEESEFVSGITSVDERDAQHLQKTLGVTSNKKGLITLLDDWFDCLARSKAELKTYSDFY
ncbi:hypothetical protein MMP66_07890 [Acinetobacter dispersus]|uniref:hypothetical protein n=1 Tax=Acinetobacter dispersus TaxID=70348 RepID=UPI001F4B8FBF|nr:hypothetical protein [Acinetobacter dispersus]MCH7394201.1 hypothetical protein [Acinetobacter dispersus]